jgi:hypothetical protein
VTIVSGTPGTGSGAITYAVAANTGAARSTTLTVAGRPVTITQAAPAAPPPPPLSCSYAISPTTVRVAGSGGQVTISVATTAGCSWSATSNTAWISIASGATGTGAGNVVLTIDPNAGGTRNGAATVAGQLVAIRQSGGDASVAATRQSDLALLATQVSLPHDSVRSLTSRASKWPCRWPASSAGTDLAARRSRLWERRAKAGMQGGAEDV